MASRNPNRPNILFILTDDQAIWAMHCAGNDEIITPNIDRLASTGMRFTHFFCASPVCSPARASLLTGRIPSAHGIHDWLRDGNMGSYKNEGYRSEKYSIEYLEEIIGYTDILKANGWHCGLTGKWHMGNSIRPQKGHDFWYACQYGVAKYFGAPMIRNGKPYIEKRYVTDVITDEGIGFLNSIIDEENPFYLGVHYTAPHSPWKGQHPEEYVNLYADCEFKSLPNNEITSFQGVREFNREQFLDEARGYYAAVTAMDACLGRLLDWLEDNDLRKSTLVVFMSDNGYCFGHHGFIGKGNGTFPLNMYEESITVPAIFSQPNRIPEGVLCHEMVSGYDFMPTLLDYLGLSYQEECCNLPGHSFKQLLLGESVKGREDVVILDEYGPVRMVRTERWKYIHRYTYGPHELFDLKHDPCEEINLVEEPEYKDIVFDLRKRLEEWFIKYVNPEIDGAREPVTGRGQQYWAGVKGRDKEQYASR